MSIYVISTHEKGGYRREEKKEFNLYVWAQMMTTTTQQEKEKRKKMIFHCLRLF